MPPESQADPIDADPTIAGNTVGDHPTSDDTLGFKPYVEAIASFLTTPATRPPITISIEGEWGSGKSSFLLQLESAILALSPTDQPPPLTLRFNAWRHDKQDQLWAAFALAFVDSLRKSIGWPRALYGDLKLFLKRLHGVRAWLELAVLAISLLIAILAAWRYHSLLTPTNLKALLTKLTTPNKDPQLDPQLLARIAEHGTWGALATLAIAGIYRFHSSFKLPLSLNLKKYLAQPDYEGHTAFIETFHLDLTRLVQSYAGTRRVFIFIDDLDRCDVPKAAELMQAINLMIGDSQNLVFVLGMDREKVAAGVALKYKDLLPFLRESALWKPNTDRNDFTPLYFGYGYLEKFIQLSFTLPIPNNRDALDRFLQPHPDPIPHPSPANSLHSLWSRFFGRSVKNQSRPVSDLAGDAPRAADSTDSAEPPSAAPSAAEPIYHRVERTIDNERTRDIVRMTAGLFEYNPRRIKQFTNTFRLALYLASDLGLLDSKPIQAQEDAEESLADKTQTPEQVGKVIALLLRFPDLRFSLEESPQLLATLERAVTRRIPDVVDLDGKLIDNNPANTYKWLTKPGALDLLTFKVGPDTTQRDRQKYSLTSFDVSTLFTVLPRAPRPKISTKSSDSTPPIDNAVWDRLNELGVRYTNIRSREPAGDSRTEHMESVFLETVALASQSFTPENLPAQQFAAEIDGQPGSRIIFLAVAYALVDLRNISRLLRMLRSYHSYFEHYWCLRTVLKYSSAFLPGYASEILQALSERWDDIALDPPRLELATQLRDLAHSYSSEESALR